MTISRLTAVATATLLLAALVACVPTAPSSTGGDVPPTSPAPDAADTIEPGTRPAPRTNATCDLLAAPGSFDPLFTAPLTLVDATRTGEKVGTIIVDEWFARQAGGVACEWQSAHSLVTSEGYYDYQGVRLLLIPATAEQWAPFAAAEVPGGNRFAECTARECRLEAHTDNGWWVSLWGYALPDEAPGAAPLDAFDRVLAVVAALPAPTSSTPIPSSLATECAVVLTPAQAAASIGESAAALVEERRFVSLGTTARDAVAGSECIWTAADGFTPVATVMVLPGGAWAMAESVDAYGAAEAVTLAGSDSGGWFRPQVEATGFDFAIDGAWVNVSASDRSEEGDSRAVILSIAAAIIANAG
jgi:hypothetical protein